MLIKNNKFWRTLVHKLILFTYSGTIRHKLITGEFITVYYPFKTHSLYYYKINLIKIP